MARKSVQPRNRGDVVASNAALASGSTPATTAVAGIVKQMPVMAALTVAPTMTDFNNLLTALKTAGLMASS